MVFNIHAGHNPDGKVACGACGLIKESTEARAVKDEVISILQREGHYAYDCTVNDGKNASDVLQKIVKKCNSHPVDYDVSIHFNAGASDRTGNGKTTGVEVYVYDEKSKAADKGKAVVDSIAALGFKNRGLRYRQNLYVINHTKAPAMLIECCFVDDLDDVSMYDVKKMAKAIAEGLIGRKITDKEPEYRYIITAKYKSKKNANKCFKRIQEEGAKVSIRKEQV